MGNIKKALRKRKQLQKIWSETPSPEHFFLNLRCSKIKLLERLEMQKDNYDAWGANTSAKAVYKPPNARKINNKLTAPYGFGDW